MPALLVILFCAFATSAACTSTSSTGSTSGSGGGPAGVCPYYGGPTNLTCPSNETLVCGFSGVPTGCCPTVAPYYCQSTQLCYPTANAASEVCGSDCQQCSPIAADTGAASSSSSSSSSSGCNVGTLLSPPAAGDLCTTGNACTESPFSCLTANEIADGLTCCCSSDGTVCIGCKPTETCGGTLGTSEVSCCSMM